MQKKIILSFIFILCAIQVFSQTRAFNDIFPNLNAAVRAAAFSQTGYIKSAQAAGGFEIIGKNSNLDSQIYEIILSRRPPYYVESLSVIPISQQITILDIYNALGNIRDLKGREYDSATRNQSVPLFEDATRITSERQLIAIPDPTPARSVPRNETVYIRLRDINFGNSYYRGEITTFQNSLKYNLTNFRNLSYLLFPVIKEENFFAQLYIEPINEGVLLYSLAGADISDFVASRIHMESAISKRLVVINSWASDGIAGKK
jgi:hypothetical protein